MPASIDDIFTTLKNVVTALNTQVQNDTALAGAQPFYNVTAATLVKLGSGRVVNVLAIVAGSADGMVYDAQSVTDTSRPIGPVQHSLVGRQVLNMPFQYGLLIVPGSGQTVAGSVS
jgi:hypothetical protein